MLRKLMWVGLLLGLLASAVRYIQVQGELKEVRAEVQRVQAEKKALEPKLIPVEEARSAIYRAVEAMDVKDVIMKRRALRLRLLQSLRGLSVQALEWDGTGFYVETREARQLERRLHSLGKLSVEPRRLAGRWP